MNGSGGKIHGTWCRYRLLGEDRLACRRRAPPCTAGRSYALEPLCSGKGPGCALLPFPGADQSVIRLRRWTFPYYIRHMRARTDMIDELNRFLG